MSQLVLAIEPDLRQSVIVTRIVREKVHADVTVVDSRDAALEAIGRTMPDVLLLSALLSPRDEDELVAHLRTLAHAGHLQTHTIPQLASAMMGPSDPERGARGLLAKFRRKKEPGQVASGCDPNVFAEEIRVFLQRAAEKKRELLDAAPGAHDWSTLPAKAPAPAAEPAVAGPADASSWSSPFEWRSDRPSLLADPESLTAHPESPIANPDSLILDPESRIAHPESPIASLESLITPSESLIANPEPLVAFPDAAPEMPVAALETMPMAAEDPAARALETEPAWLAVASEAVVADVDRPAETSDALAARSQDEETDEELDDEEPSVAARPAHDTLDSLLDAMPGTAGRFELEEGLGSDEGFGTDQESGIGDAGLGIEDQGSGMRNSSVPPRLGSLATWTRSEAARPAARASADDLRAIIAGLAVPATIASVAYPRGCRIRRVRVPGGPHARLADAPGPVILSKRLLEERRNSIANP